MLSTLCYDDCDCTRSQLLLLLQTRSACSISGVVGDAVGIAWSALAYSSSRKGVLDVVGGRSAFAGSELDGFVASLFSGKNRDLMLYSIIWYLILSR